jgi:hypothetical protein
MEVTVSVSTVMLCEVLSPPFPFTVGGFTVEVLDCREDSGGGAVAEALLLSAFMLPVSLPLSLAMSFGFALKLLETCASVISACDEVSEIILSSRFSNAFSRLCWGDGRGLTSCTVSKVDVLLPELRVGVFVPGCKCDSSVSGSASTSGVDDGVER